MYICNSLILEKVYTIWQVNGSAVKAAWLLSQYIVCTCVTERPFVTSGMRHRHARVPTDSVADRCHVVSSYLHPFSFASRCKFEQLSAAGEASWFSSPRTESRASGCSLCPKLLPKIENAHCDFRKSTGVFNWRGLTKMSWRTSMIFASSD